MEEKDNELKRREILRMSNEESHKLTLECIRSALVYLMSTKPYEKITITEIIERSGVSRAAFYRNYAGKDEVLQDEMAELTQKLNVALSNSLLEKDAKAWLRHFFDEVKLHRKEMEILFKANLDVKQIFNEITIEKKKSDPMIRYKIWVFLSSLWSVVGLWIEEGFQKTPEELADFVSEIIVVND